MGEPRICLVITASNPEEAEEAIKQALSQGPDLIEVRFDYMEKPEGFTRIRETTTLPLIATNRSTEQGGLWEGCEENRVQALLDASDAGFDYIDLELSTKSLDKVGRDVKELGAKLIVSYHNFENTPRIQALRGLVRKQIEAGADTCKIVGMARDHGDNLVYLRLLQETPGISLVTFGMGKAGVLSRIFSPIFGGSFTYASINVGGESASGQLTISEMRTIYKILGV